MSVYLSVKYNNDDGPNPTSKNTQRQVPNYSINWQTTLFDSLYSATVGRFVEKYNNAIVRYMYRLRMKKAPLRKIDGVLMRQPSDNGGTSYLIFSANLINTTTIAMY